MTNPTPGPDPRTFAMPGPRLVGFRYGYLREPDGKLWPLTIGSVKGIPDILEEPAVAKCASGYSHPAPQRGCTCGIYAFSTPGFLAASSYDEWLDPRHVPAVALHWGRIILGERGFRAEHQAVIGIILPGTTEWETAFRERHLPVETVTGATRLDALFALARLGAQYGTLLEDIDHKYRTPPSPQWTMAIPTPALGTIPKPMFPPGVPPRKAPKRTTRMPSTGTCQCGCGTSTRAMFKPGHDSVHKGNLKKRARRGDQAAQDELDLRGW